jgi:hypothetical protein
MTRDDDFGAQVGRTIEARVRRIRPVDDLEALLTKSAELRRRQRRRFAVGTTLLLIVVAIAAYSIGTASTSSTGDETTAVVVPRAPTVADVYAPEDLARAGIEISSAYRDVFGPASNDAKVEAMQLGPQLLPLLHRSGEIAQRFGYTEDQISRNTVTVSDPSFIDATHAIVKFSITIPDHGTVVKDRLGYAVQIDGRWLVAARTVCDIVWPGTTSPACPAKTTS